MNKAKVLVCLSDPQPPRILTQFKGTWDQYRQRILSNGNLARIANTTGLADCIHRNPLNPCAISTRLAANVVEAVVGAVCLDGGLEAAEEVMKTLGCVI